MKIKKILLILILFMCVTGCTKLNNLSYDDVINKVIAVKNSPNTYRRGYKYFLPKGVSIYKAGPNYAVIESKDTYYYLYIDLISFNSKKDINYEIKNNIKYSKFINYDEKKGYIEIKKYENNQYLIEIMYNYAKIEVMVDDSQINKALANSISILKSIVYDEKVIETLLKDDNLTYTEEKFDMFNKSNKKTGILNYTDTEVEIEDNNIKDTDYIN